MFDTRYIGLPEKESDLASIFDLLCVCDGDFVPPLSSRESSLQKHFGDAPQETKPYRYFEVIRNQHFTAAYEGEHMVAFLTFLPDYRCEALAEYGVSTYMTTACVYPECRGHGLVTRLYDIVEYGLPERMRHDFVTTRTWSTNRIQLHAFGKRGYEVVTVLPNDRGAGIDTIYFAKRVRGGEPICR